MYPVRLGIAVGLREQLGSDALWLSFRAAMVSTLLMATILYFHGGWKKNASMRIDAHELQGEAACVSQSTEAAPSSNAFAPNAPLIAEVKPDT